MKRTLTLKREALTELTAADLSVVVGAAAEPTIGSCPVKYCVNQLSDALSCDQSCGHSGCCSIDTCG
ncbi:MAG TPA: hypothetical protein VNA20_00800 [Frankiaceae bacterium]|nr:hypothetical protein [Frankiaceae bacterium]